jgi:hypothetical protein
MVACGFTGTAETVFFLAAGLRAGGFDFLTVFLGDGVEELAVMVPAAAKLDVAAALSSAKLKSIIRL